MTKSGRGVPRVRFLPAIGVLRRSRNRDATSILVEQPDDRLVQGDRIGGRDNQAVFAGIDQRPESCHKNGRQSNGHLEHPSSRWNRYVDGLYCLLANDQGLAGRAAPYVERTA